MFRRGWQNEVNSRGDARRGQPAHGAWPAIARGSAHSLPILAMPLARVNGGRAPQTPTLLQACSSIVETNRLCFVEQAPPEILQFQLRYPALHVVDVEQVGLHLMDPQCIVPLLLASAGELAPA